MFDLIAKAVALKDKVKEFLATPKGKVVLLVLAGIGAFAIVKYVL